MTAPTRYAVVLDPLGMANVVSDREPGPGPALRGLTGEWVRGWRDGDWRSFADALSSASWWNQRHKPARPAERAGE